MRLKSTIEHRTGLSLADAVNVALFVLTVVSLVLAAAGLAIALFTYLDARHSGEAQTRILDTSKNEMEKATASLGSENVLLQQSLEATKAQQETLRENIAVAERQLEILTIQNAREASLFSKKPLISLVAECGPDLDRRYSIHVVGKYLRLTMSREVQRRIEKRHGVLSDSLGTGNGGVAYCLFKLINDGSEVMRDGFATLSYQVVAFEGSESLEYSRDLPPVDDFRLTTTPSGFLGAEDNETEFKPNFVPFLQEKEITIFSGKDVFPGGEIPNSLLTLRIKNSMQLKFDFRFGGANEAPVRLPVWLTLKTP